jgi:hypothetical protein
MNRPIRPWQPPTILTAADNSILTVDRMDEILSTTSNLPQTPQGGLTLAGTLPEMGMLHSYVLHHEQLRRLRQPRAQDDGVHAARVALCRSSGVAFLPGIFHLTLVSGGVGGRGGWRKGILTQANLPKSLLFVLLRPRACCHSLSFQGSVRRDSVLQHNALSNPYSSGLRGRQIACIGDILLLMIGFSWPTCK